MTYDEAVQYIEEIPKFTKKTALEHTEKILDVLGHPEQNLKIIHVAGTNGKGSTCSYIRSMFMEGGYRVGFFTSPHLVKINERFQINQNPVSDDVFLDAFQTVMDAAKITMDAGESHPTYFETLFLMGIIIFQKEQVDYVVLEVGLGGRLDATNVIRQPLASIITSISLDHTEYLGDTVSAIASEKAGIIKAGSPVIYDAHDPEAAAVIRTRAEEIGTTSFALDPSMYHILQSDKNGVRFAFHMPQGDAVELQIPSVAAYQMMNASLAFYTMLRLQDEHKIAVDTLVRGLGRMAWPCRMETVMDGVIVDGAHNEDGIAEFVKTVESFHDAHAITLLFSAVVDKRYTGMVAELCEGIHPEHVVTTTIAGNREVAAEQLAELFRQEGCSHVEAIDDVGGAFERALELRGDGMMFCVGSLYLAGMVKNWISGRTL